MIEKRPASVSSDGEGAALVVDMSGNESNAPDAAGSEQDDRAADRGHREPADSVTGRRFDRYPHRRHRRRHPATARSGGRASYFHATPEQRRRSTPQRLRMLSSGVILASLIFGVVGALIFGYFAFSLAG